MTILHTDNLTKTFIPETALLHNNMASPVGFLTNRRFTPKSSQNGNQTRSGVKSNSRQNKKKHIEQLFSCRKTLQRIEAWINCRKRHNMQWSYNNILTKSKKRSIKNKHDDVHCSITVAQRRLKL